MVSGNVRSREGAGIVRPSRRLATLLLVALAAGCASTATKEDPAEVRSGIEAVNRQFMDAFARRDAAALGLLYAEDGQVLPPGAPPLEGREAIVNMWSSVLALPISGVRLETVEIGPAEGSVWEVGRYAMIGTDGATAESGKYVVIWKHDESGWKIYRDMWSSDTPAAAPAGGRPSTP